LAREPGSTKKGWDVATGQVVNEHQENKPGTNRKGLPGNIMKVVTPVRKPSSTRNVFQYYICREGVKIQ
jgi:hypothetical protein